MWFHSATSSFVWLLSLAHMYILCGMVWFCSPSSSSFPDPCAHGHALCAFTVQHYWITIFWKRADRKAHYWVAQSELGFFFHPGLDTSSRAGQWNQFGSVCIEWWVVVSIRFCLADLSSTTTCQSCRLASSIRYLCSRFCAYLLVEAWYSAPSLFSMYLVLHTCRLVPSQGTTLFRLDVVDWSM